MAHSMMDRPQSKASDPGSVRRTTSFRPTLDRLERRNLLSDGSVDSTFGAAGRAIVGFAEGTADWSGARASAIQGDGKVVAVGWVADDADGGHADFAAARLTVEGAPDPSFGAGGKAIVAFDLGGSGDDMAEATAVQPDGKILIAGRAARNSDGDGDVDFAVARLTADGRLDPTFGAGGKLTVAFNLGGRNIDAASEIAVDASGRIVVVGTAEFAFDADGRARTHIAVARLTADGMLDTTFGAGGSVRFDEASATVTVELAKPFAPKESLQLTANGSALAGGTYVVTVRR